MTGKPSVLFVCVHNAGRSQMAAGWLTHLAGGDIEVRSAGTEPADGINPVAVQASDVVITMGCGDECPYHPGKRYLDWKLADPAGQGIDAVRPIRDDIRDRVEALIHELRPTTSA